MRDEVASVCQGAVMMCRAELLSHRWTGRDVGQSGDVLLPLALSEPALRDLASQAVARVSTAFRSDGTVIVAVTAGSLT